MTTKANLYEILLTTDASDERWQLGRLPPPRGAFLLVGWSIGDADGETPDVVVDILVDAMLHAGRVILPCSSVLPPVGAGWHSVGSDYIAAVPLPPRRDRWLKGLARQQSPSLLVLLSTRRPEAVRRMFDDPVYPWWLQGQFALLSDQGSGAQTIPLDPTVFARLIEPDWADSLGPLGDAGVDAILRPGVDGSVVGILCVTTSYRLRMGEFIRACAAQRSIPCGFCSQAEFVEALASR